MEPKVNEEDNEDSSSSKQSQPKNRRIKKSPKPVRVEPVQSHTELRDSVAPKHIPPQFGVFESEMQKQSRLEKFWLSEIDHYYKMEVTTLERQLLNSIIEE
jgi:hypothetical protein